MPRITRRQLLVSLPALGTIMASPFKVALSGQSGKPPIRVRSLNHCEIAVADPKRTIDFYQGLFGMPVQARVGTTTILRAGAGLTFLSIRPLEGDITPGITYYGFGVEDFNVDRIVATLAAHGVAKADAVGPMKVSVAMRDDHSGLVFGDPDGIVSQLSDVRNCSPLGSRCPAPEAPSKKGLIALTDLSHLTMFSRDPQRSNMFYRNLFGFSFRSYQGPTAPTLAVGPTVQFLMFAGGGAGAREGALTAARPATINHACWSLGNFRPDDILKTLESYGLKPREGVQGPAGPLRHYVTMRMENRGGATGGTPELYFTDPDGLLMQLQDTSYCGGGGFLGNECPKV